jgi:hypothetical protein
MMTKECNTNAIHSLSTAFASIGRLILTYTLRNGKKLHNLSQFDFSGYGDMLTRSSGTLSMTLKKQTLSQSSLILRNFLVDLIRIKASIHILFTLKK